MLFRSLAAVASSAGDDDNEEEERLLPPPANPPSQHQGEALSFLSQLACYGQGLLEEVLVIDLKSPKVPRTTSRNKPVSSRHVVRFFFLARVSCRACVVCVVSCRV